MIFIVFTLLFWLASVVSCVLLLLAATAVVAPAILAVRLIRIARAASPKREALRRVSRLAVVAGLLTLLIFSFLMLASIWFAALSDYNRIVQTVGVIGGTVTIAGWIGSILTPPLSRADFEQGMKTQNEAIMALTEAIKSNNEAISALPERIAALLDERRVHADETIRPDDVDD